MKKTAVLGKRLYFLALAVMPFALGCFFSIRTFIRALKSDNFGVDVSKYINIGYRHPYTALAVFIRLLAALMYFVAVRRERFLSKGIRAVAIPTAVGGFLRLSLYFIFLPALKADSDAAHVWNIVSGTGNDKLLKLKSFQNGWNNFTALTKWLVDSVSMPYTVGILAMMLFDIATIALITLLTLKITQNRSCCFVVGILYAVNPAVIANTFFYTGDHITKFFITAAVYVFICALNSAENRKYPLYLLSGILAGIGGCFKGVGTIFAVVGLIVLAYEVIFSKNGGKKLLSFVMAAVLIIVPTFGINKIALSISSDILDTKVQDLLLYHQLYVGLKPDGQGQLCYGEDTAYFEHLIVDGVPAEQARKMTVEKLKEMWRKAGYNPIPLISGKLNFIYGENISAINHFNYGIDICRLDGFQLSVRDFINDYIHSFSQILYIFTMIAGIVGVCFLYKTHFENNRRLMVTLMSFGFYFLLIFIECQPRYKNFVMGFTGIISAVGFCRICDFLVKTAGNHKVTQRCENDDFLKEKQINQT